MGMDIHLFAMAKDLFPIHRAVFSAWPLCRGRTAQGVNGERGRGRSSTKRVFRPNYSKIARRWFPPKRRRKGHLKDEEGFTRRKRVSAKRG